MRRNSGDEARREALRRAAAGDVAAARELVRILEAEQREVDYEAAKRWVEEAAKAAVAAARLDKDMALFLLDDVAAGFGGPRSAPNWKSEVGGWGLAIVENMTEQALEREPESLERLIDSAADAITDLLSGEVARHAVEKMGAPDEATGHRGESVPGLARMLRRQILKKLTGDVEWGVLIRALEGSLVESLDHLETIDPRDAARTFSAEAARVYGREVEEVRDRVRRRSGP